MEDPNNFSEKLKRIVGADNVRVDAQSMAPFLTERRGRMRPQALAVVLPASTHEVAAVVKLAAAHGIPLVPQGGNTGLVGGGVPDESGAALVLSLMRMNRVMASDAANDTLTVEAGVTLQEAQDAASKINRLFPLSLASEGTCTIGGNIASNAGGTAVLAYGNMRDLVLGLEVVLPNGDIWDGLKALRKDNSGYALKHLFIGSEGTLGIVTKAVLRLFSRPKALEAGWAGFASIEAALHFFRHLKEHFGAMLTTAELLPQRGMDMLAKHLPDTRLPLQMPHPWQVFFEISSPLDLPLREHIARVLDAEGLYEDAVLAHSEQQRLAFWRLREAMPDVQKYEGASIKHDISVPLSALPHMIYEGMALALRVVPDCRPMPFGHLGDGNLHFNITQPVGMDPQDFMAQWDAMNTAIHALVVQLGGSIAAEHGIGRFKAAAMDTVKTPQEMALMRTIRKAIDPQGIMNPAAVILDN